MTATNDQPEPTGYVPPSWSCLWTRGDGCSDLAAVLDQEARRVQGDLRAACIDARASLLVTKRLSSGFDLVNAAVPHGLVMDSVTEVAALVAGGANSLLAAQVAATMSRRLGIPGRMLLAYENDEDQPEALTIIEQLFAEVPALEYRVVQASPAADIASQLGSQELMVLGAPSGSWLQRQFFGKGARLVSHAPAGAVVVQAAPERVFQTMVEPSYVSRHLGSGDALRLHPEGLLAVVDAGRLIGVASRSSLAMAGDGAPVETCMDEPVAVHAADLVEDALALAGSLGGVPVPVTDGDGFLVGMFEPAGS